jgi:acyl-CoA synthetase (NDP forming)
MTRPSPPLRPLLRPRSVAIVGDSPRGGRGAAMHESLLRWGFEGEIFPVNPRHREIRGLAAFASVREVPRPVELAAIAVPAERVNDVLRDCAARGVAAAIVIASGFGEAGEEGRARQRELEALCRGHAIDLCGPNCYGVANFAHRFVAYSGPIAEPMRLGPVALVFQSGALTHGATEPAVLRDIGFSCIVTTGNEAVTDLSAYIEALAEDDHVRVISCFVEAIRRPAAFAEAAHRALGRGKRIVVLKVGRSEAGRRAAVAHTGALAGPDRAWDALFRRLGVLRVSDLDELIEASELLSHLSDIGEGNVALASISGGGSGIMADLASELGLRLGSLRPATAERLRATLPAFANVNNPLDLTGAVGENPALRDHVLRALAEDGSLAAIGWALNTPTSRDPTMYRETVRSLARAAAGTAKPLFAFTMTSGPMDEGLAEAAHGAGLPLLQGFRETIAVVAAAQAATRARSAWRDPEEVAGPPPAGLVQTWRSLGSRALTQLEARETVAAIGVPTPRCRLVRSPEAAASAAVELGWPVVLKVQSPEVTHKTDVGGVRVGVGSPEEAALAFEQILGAVRAALPHARLDGVVVEEQAPEGLDAIVGVSNRDEPGPVVLVGLGGVFVEAIDDVALRMAPVDEREADRMLGELRSGRLLEGWRGRGPCDREALARTVAQVSRLAWWLRDELGELDLNPTRVFAQGAGVRVLDALVVRTADRAPSGVGP